jgi:predicted AAA+ superfamily ATPase
VMTGSSARKLKRGGANLLAGRAFVYHLFPLSYRELGSQFELEETLQRGTLPKVSSFVNDNEKIQFLQAYTYTYLKEEIWAEHFINKLDPFRRFLEVAAQCNGKIINYANIARDVGVNDKTVKEYFSILEDTLIGFFLEPFEHSFRKRLSLKPKFYFFDTGVTRALARLLSVPLSTSTSAYGEVFEHFIILECLKLSSYLQPEYRFSYLKTKDDAEIDLVVERPGKPILFIEIKSSNNVRPEDLSTFSKLTQSFDQCEAICLSRDPHPKRFDHITIMPWKEGLDRFL